MTDVVFSNAAIIARMADKILTKARIGAMVRAKTFNESAAILSECGYGVTSGTIDEIVDAERAQTISTFMDFCGDEALKACVKARYESLPTREDAFFKTIQENIGKIQTVGIRQYFQVYLDAHKVGGKISDTALFNIASELRHDLDGAGPVFYWYVLKQSEFMAVKVILLGKKLGHVGDKIMRDLRGLYARFR